VADEPPQHLLEPGRDGRRGDVAVEVAGEQRRLGEEGIPVVAGPLPQPHGPVLALVGRHRHLRRRVLERQPHQLVLARDVVVEGGDADAEVIGHGADGEPFEPDVQRGVGDHGPADPGRSTDRSHRGTLHYRTLFSN
jgi:hypothetical protein